MNHDTNITHVHTGDEIAVAAPRSPSWGAIIAGAIAGLAVHFLLLMLGTAFGLGAAEPRTDDNPIASFGTGSAIVWSISALISLWIGGWVAGRCAARGSALAGGTHGFMVWCLATVLGLLLVVSGAGALIGGATRIVGQGLETVGQAAGAAGGGLAELAKQAAERTTGTIDSFIDEAAAREGMSQAEMVAVRREVGQAVRRMFADGTDLRNAENRNAVVQALTAGGVNQADAEGMVDRWSASMESLRRDLEQAKATAETKAREAADATASALSKAALWTFIGFVLGAIAATWGGRSGGRWEYRHIGTVDRVTTERGRPITHLPGHA